MRPTLSPPQIDALLAIAGFCPSARKPWPQTLEALERQGLIEDGCAVPQRATPLGMVAARMRGWVPTEDQRGLIRALALAEVRSGKRYRLPIEGPATVLASWSRYYLALTVPVRLRRRDGRVASWAATPLCSELAGYLNARSGA